MLDFTVLAGASFIILVSVWITTNVIARMRKGKHRSFPLTIPVWQTIVAGAIVAGATFIASFATPPLGRAFVLLFNYSSFPKLDLPNVVWGIGLVTSVTLAPVLATFGVSDATSLRSPRSIQSMIAASGTHLGAMLGLASPVDPILAAFFNPILGPQNVSLSGVFLLAPVFGYAFFVVGSFVDGRAKIPPRETALDLAVISVLLIPLLASLGTFWLLLFSLYALVIASTLTRLIISPFYE